METYVEVYKEFMSDPNNTVQEKQGLEMFMKMMLVIRQQINLRRKHAGV